MMNFRDEILDLTKKLVHIKSVVNTDGEKEFAKSLFDMIQAIPYFKENPSHVLMQQTLHDERERYNVLAFVKGKKGNSNRTVILMGHFDTVGISDFGQLIDVACAPDELIKKLKNEQLPEKEKEQLDSGDWLFGRGALDMKSGLASNLYLLKYFSERPEELDGNLVFIGECDEEDSSHGILSALKVLKQWKEEHNFHYVAAINADFVAPEHDEDDNRYIYKGTIGKLLPTFFVTGAETHVGSPFEGLDPNFIIAELTRQISYNPELSEQAFGEVTVPPVSLKQTDLKPNYTVQTALSAFSYYNFFTYTWSPKKVLEMLKEQAEIAFQHAIQDLNDKYKKYCSMVGKTYSPLPWEVRVFTYKEMDELLTKEHGEEYTRHMDEFKQSLLNDKELDTRLFAVKVVEEAWKWMKDKRPAIVLFYSSLYSPSVVIDEETEEGKALVTALNEAVEEVQSAYKHPIVTRNFFPHISDMSFVAMNDDEEEIRSIAENNPAWGTKHYVNYEDVLALNVPVINVGPYGLDAHKRLERTEKTFTFEIVPNITKRIIEKLIIN